MSFSTTLPMTRELEMLAALMEQDQFELLLSDQPGEYRVVYLMNDAVESFLVFHNVALTGQYDQTYGGPLSGELSRDADALQYVLVVHQGTSVCTLFFERLEVEVHLFDYGETGHIWVRGHEHLRQLEYRLAILQDKWEYLGEEYCTEEELKLKDLADFPPLNFSCFPAVPEKYLVASIPKWAVTREAIEAMEAIVREAGDEKLLRLLERYEKRPLKRLAKRMAKLLTKQKHATLVELLTRKIEAAADVYPNRTYGEEQAEWDNMKAAACRVKQELEAAGHQVRLVYEEPFVYARDSVDFAVHWITEEGCGGLERGKD